MGSTNIEQPSTPTTPSYSSSMSDYIENYPRLVALQQQYAPIEAQQAIDLAKTYAQPYGEAMKSAQEALYPGTTKIQEILANKAIEGMSGAPSASMTKAYQDQLRANLGTNVGSPIGADYASRGLMQMNEDWNRYYQNLGLSVTNRQPLTQSTTPAWTNQTSQANLGQTLGYNQGIYGTNANLYGTNLNAYTQQQQMNSPWNYVSGAGNLLQGLGGFGLGMASAKKQGLF